MCGLAGIVDYEGRLGGEELRRVAAAMAARMEHRGPDGHGVWLDPSGRCALSHQRLSILDLSERGRQPMTTPGDTAVLSFNGEIYNHAELRRDLSQRGAVFRSRCDAEAVLHAFADAEPEALDRLDGMYAFAAWNRAERRLLLARDPFGKKPLYLARGKGWLAFASELQALRCVPGFRAELDPNSLAEYLLLQYVHAPATIYRDCEKLEPGCWLRIEFPPGRAPRESRGRHFGFVAREPSAAAEASASGSGPNGRVDLKRAADALRPVIVRAVEKRLQSDVPLGVLLSGGIDSALVAAVMTRELGCDVQSFSIGFEDSIESEHELARDSARQLGTRHADVILSPDAVAWLPRIAEALDEPLGDSGCLPMFLLARFAREHVTVALSGDGGDELFGGYARYSETLAEEGDWRRRARWLLRTRKRWTPADAYLSHRWLMFTPDEVGSLLGDDARRHANELLAPWRRALADARQPLVHRMRTLDGSSYLPGAVLAKVDRMSMAASLEVRCPLLDRDVAEAAAQLGVPLVHHGGLPKPLLRHLAGHYLDAATVARPKRGFGLPGASWTRDAMLELFRQRLLDRASPTQAWLARSSLSAFADRQRNHFSVFQTWTLLVLDAWLDAHGPASH